VLREPDELHKRASAWQKLLTGSPTERKK